MKLSDYILLSRDERTKHIDLTTDCSYEYYYQDKTPLLNFLGVKSDISWFDNKIHRCHLCESGRRRGECSNPRHMYIGTASENSLDIPPDTRKKIQDAAAEVLSKALSLKCVHTGKIYSFPSQHEAARVLNLAQSALSHMVNGRRKSHKGFTLWTD